MKRILWLWCVVFLGWLMPQEAFADHYLGSTIQYRCLGNDQYEITLSLYTDCDPSTLALDSIHPVVISPRSPFCSTQSDFIIDLDSVGQLSEVDVSQLCVPSRCSGGFPPGVQQFVYRGIVTLAPGCLWEISFARCCRSVQLTNIRNPNGEGLYVPTIIDTRTPLCNASPQFSNLPLYTTCHNTLSIYSLGASDADGDSLIFSLVRPRTSRFDTAQFVTGLSYLQPLAIEPGTQFVLDSLTGELRFVPRNGMAQVAILAIKIEEIRNGVVINATVREVQITVLMCSNRPPILRTLQPTSGMSLLDSNELYICKGGMGQFQMVFQDLDNHNITLQTNASTVIRGGQLTYTIDNRVRDSIVVTFDVDATQAFVGTYPFAITARDDGCLVNALQSFDVLITIGGVAYQQVAYCTSDPDPTPTIVGGQGVFSVLGGQTGVALDTATGVIDLSASLPGSYQILYEPQGGGCAKDTLGVILFAGADAEIAYPQDFWCLQGPDPTPSFIATPGGQFRISAGGTIDALTGTVDLAQTGTFATYRVFYTVDTGNCQAIGTYDLTVIGQLSYPRDTFCTADPDPTPTVIDTNGIFINLPSNPPGLSLDPNSGRIDLSASSAGTYRVLYQRNSGISYSCDTLVVTIKQSPSANFNYPRGVWCQAGPDPVPQITGTPGGAFFAFGPIQFDFTTGTVDVANSPTGRYDMYYRVDSGGCAATDTFPLFIMNIEAMQALANQYYICGNRWDTISLDASVRYRGFTPALGQFQWSPSTHLNNPNIANPTAILNQPQTYVLTYDDGLCPPLTDTLSFDISYPAQLLPLVDQQICETDSAKLSAAVVLVGGAQFYSDSTPTTVTLEDTTLLTLPVSGFNGTTIDATDLTSLEICLDFNIPVLSHLSIYLIAPSGERVLLTHNNGGFNTSLNGGTFSADVGNIPITNIPAFTAIPPNQSYFPQNGPGGFSSLLGATANGNWQLMIIHDNGGISTGSGSLASWCLHFRDLSVANFQWSPDATLSCNLCDSTWASPNRDQQYTVIATNLAGCKDTSTVQVLVDTLLAAPVLVCGRQTFVSTTVRWVPVPQAIGYQVQIDGGAPQTLGILADSVQVTGLRAGECATIVVQALSSSNCPFGRPDTLVCCARDCGGVGPINVSSSAGTQFCQGTSIQLFADTGYVSYQWQRGDTTRIITVDSSGTYQVTATDQWGCQDTGRIVVTAQPPLVLGLPDTVRFCVGDSVLLQANHPNGITYQWSQGSQTASIWVQQSGGYQITVTDPIGCLTRDSIWVQARPTLQLALSFQPLSCAPPSVADGALQATVSGGSGGYQYRWSTNDTTTQIQGLALGPYCLTVTDAAGCKIDTCVTMTAPSALGVQWQTIPISCAGGNDGQVTAQGTGGVGGYQYQWLPNGPSSPIRSQLSAGFYQLQISDANGCLDTLTLQLDDPPALGVTGTTTATRCYGDSTGQLQIQGQGGTGTWAYRWANGATDSIRQGLPAGTYCVTVTDAQGCTADTCLVVNQPPLLVIGTIAATLPRCHGDSTGQLQAIPAGGTLPYAYRWSTVPVQNTVAATGLAAGPYTLTLTDAQGCATTQSVLLGQPSPLGIQNKIIDPAECVQATGRIRVQVSGGSPTYDYLWSDGQLDSTAVGLAEGLYIITVTDVEGCTLIDSSNVPVDRNGLQAQGFTIPTSCEGDATGRLEARIIGGSYPRGRRPTYRLLGVANDAWQYYGGFDGLRAGLYTLEVRDGAGCVADTQLVIGSGPPFYLEYLTPDTTVEYLDPIQIEARLNNPTGAQYTWTVQTGQSDALPPNPGYQFDISLLHTTQYRFRATSPRGCTVDSMVWVLVEKPRRANAPLAFTPNGDGVNDRFFIQGGSKVDRVLLLRVYDRWGSLIYEGRDMPINAAQLGWDGTFRGQPVNAGMYVWYAEVLFVDDYIQLLEGGVHVLR